MLTKDRFNAILTLSLLAGSHISGVCGQQPNPGKHEYPDYRFDWEGTISTRGPKEVRNRCLVDENHPKGFVSYKPCGEGDEYLWQLTGQVRYYGQYWYGTAKSKKSGRCLEFTGGELFGKEGRSNHADKELYLDDLDSDTGVFGEVLVAPCDKTKQTRSQDRKGTKLVNYDPIRQNIKIFLEKIPESSLHGGRNETDYRPVGKGAELGIPADEWIAIGWGPDVEGGLITDIADSGHMDKDQLCQGRQEAKLTTLVVNKGSEEGFVGWGRGWTRWQLWSSNGMTGFHYMAGQQAVDKLLKSLSESAAVASATMTPQPTAIGTNPSESAPAPITTDATNVLLVASTAVIETGSIAPAIPSDGAGADLNPTATFIDGSANAYPQVLSTAPSGVPASGPSTYVVQSGSPAHLISSGVAPVELAPTIAVSPPIVTSAAAPLSAYAPSAPLSVETPETAIPNSASVQKRSIHYTTLKTITKPAVAAFRTKPHNPIAAYATRLRSGIQARQAKEEKVVKVNMFLVIIEIMRLNQISSYQGLDSDPRFPHCRLRTFYASRFYHPDGWCQVRWFAFKDRKTSEELKEYIEAEENGTPENKDPRIIDANRKQAVEIYVPGEQRVIAEKKAGLIDTEDMKTLENLVNDA